MDQSIIKHPIYIISKGRADSCKTANFLKQDGIEFHIAVEPQEYKAYCEEIGSKYIKKLPFSNLGKGSYPARNWCWDDSIARGAEKHFLFDDNIYRFIKFKKGLRRKSEEPISLEALYTLQAFTERYSNLPLSGYNYSSFAGTWIKKPFYLNTHVYSGMLIDNSMSHKWRLKYNEDVDLNLQVLDSGQCIVALNHYLIQKISTVTQMKGGNQDELYKNNDPKKKALKSKSLEQLWPQYVEVKYRFGRPHHHVSWKKHFKQGLKRKPDYEKIVKQQTKTFNQLGLK